MDIFSGILNDEISDPNSFNIQFDNISPEQIDYVFSTLYSQHIDFVCKNVAETLIIESFMKFLGIRESIITKAIDYLYKNISFDSFVDQCSNLQFCPELIRNIDSCIGPKSGDILAKIIDFKYFNAAEKIIFGKKLISYVYNYPREHFDIICGLYVSVITNSFNLFRNMQRIPHYSTLKTSDIVRHYSEANIIVNDFEIIHQNNTIKHLLINNKIVKLSGNTTTSNKDIIGVNTYDTIIEHITKIKLGIVDI